MRRTRVDAVIIRFRRNARGQRIITAFRVIGRAAPCNRFLVVGGRVLFAERCLLNNGFIRVLRRGNVVVFVRIR